MSQAKREAPNQGCTECTGLRSFVKNLKQDNRDLKNLVSGLQGQLAAATSARSTAEAAAAAAAAAPREPHRDDSTWQSERASMRKELEALRLSVKGGTSDQELERLRARLRKSEGDREAAETRCRVAETQAADLNKEKIRWMRNRVEWTEERQRLVADVDDLRHQLARARDASSQHGQDHDALRAEIQRVLDQLAVKESEWAQLQQCHASCAQERDSFATRVPELEQELSAERNRRACAQSSVTAVKAQLATKTSELEQALHELQRLSDADKACEEAQAAANHAAAQLDSLRKQLKAETANKECAVAGQHKALEKCDGLEADLLQTKDRLRAAVQDLADARGKAVQLEKDLEELLLERATFEQRMEKQLKLHKAALEAALNSVVRLCVVAPTVNIHTGDQTQAFKAPLPTSKLKGFVQDQVLPKFAKIFVQPEEGSAPSGGPLDAWLQNLLAEMQGSIERHLTKLFSQVRT